MNAIRQWNARLKIKYISYMVIMIYGIGLIGTTRSVVHWLSGRFAAANRIVPLEWLEDFFFQHGKFEEISVFIAICAAIFFYMMGIAVLGKKLLPLSRLRHSLLAQRTIWRIGYLVVAFVFNIAAFVKPSQSMGLLAVQVWLWVILLATAWLPVNTDGNLSPARLKRLEQGQTCLLVLLVLHFLLIVAPFLTGPLKVMNEYLAVPEKTLMRLPGKEPYYVDNTTFINQHKLFGFHNKQDVDSPNSPQLEWKLDQYGHNIANKIKGKEFVATAQYVPDESKIVLVQPFSEKQMDQLMRWVDSPNDKRNLLALQISALAQQRELSHRRLTDEERLFLKNNAMEIHWQILNRWFIHHHNFVLNPIQEYALGKDHSQIFSQYIWLPVMMLKEVLERVGTISYQDYVKIWYSIYYWYFFLYLFLFWRVFRERSYVLAFLLLLIININISEFTFFYLAPGWNPIRHFFDIVVFYMFFRYVAGGQLRWLAGAYASVMLSVLFNWQFGLFLLISLSGTVLVGKLLSLPLGRLPGDRAIQLSAIGVLLVLPLLGYARFGEDEFAIYHLMGLLGFPSSFWTRAILLILYSLGWFLVFRKNPIREPWRSLCIFSLGYSFLAIIYYLRCPIYYHITSMIWIHALAIFSFLRGSRETYGVGRSINKWVMGVVVTSLFLTYIPTTGFYYYTKYKFDRVFDTHQVYEWNFAKARFLSTMDPAYFNDSVAIIEKYGKNGPGIFILSKYDNILPFLANKYSSMPFPDLTQFLITTKEVEKSVQAIVVNRPEYLFVDTDIDRTLIVDVINKESPLSQGVDSLHNESVWRVQRVGLLKTIFDQVRNDYEPVPVESGKLVSVYRRKYKN